MSLPEKKETASYRGPPDYLPRDSELGTGLAMLLNDMDVDYQDSAEAHIVREPKGLDEDVLLCKFVDERHDVLGGLDAFLDVGADH